MRLPGKEFPQYTPDGSGGWISGLNGTNRLLYRLPELMAADPARRQVFVVEGEKDVEALRGLGLVASTNSGGADGWRPEFAESFACRHVVILPDNDQPGRKWAHRVANDLLTAGAAAVKIIDLPGLAEHGDTSDWLEAGNTKDDLRALVLAAPLAAASNVAGHARPLAEVLDDVERFLRRFVTFASAHQAVTAALWVAHTHALGAAAASPYLAVTSAEPESGKTRLFETLELVVAEPWRVTQPSEAVVFRKIDQAQPTLLLDEVDAIFGPKAGTNTEGLRGLLNASNRRGTTVPRCVGKDYKLTDFKIFCPKALAGIGRLPITVRSRSIPIRLVRRKRDEVVERFRYRLVKDDGVKVQAALAEVMAKHQDQLAGMYPEIPEELGDRAADSWEPLIAIADVAGGAWSKRARGAALDLSGAKVDESDSRGVLLLEDIRRIFGGADDRLASAALAERLAGLEESPWGDLDGHGKKLDARGLARRLHDYGIRPHNLRVGEKVLKGYERPDFDDAFSRYLPAPTPSERYNATATPLEAADSPDLYSTGALYGEDEAVADTPAVPLLAEPSATASDTPNRIQNGPGNGLSSGVAATNPYLPIEGSDSPDHPMSTEDLKAYPWVHR